MGENITIQDYQAMLARAANPAEADSMKARMAQQGWTINKIPIRGPMQTPLQNIQETTGKYDLLGPSSRKFADVLPGAAATVLGGAETGVIRKGLIGGLMKAGVRMGMAGLGGAGGEIARESIYRGTGEHAPPSPAAGMMGQLGVPFQPLQEALAQATMQGMGDAVSAPFRAVGKMLLKLPGKNLKWDTAEEALKQNVPLNVHSGIATLKARAQPIIQARNVAIAAHDVAGKHIDVDKDLLMPTMNELENMADATNEPDVAKRVLQTISSRWRYQRANSGVAVQGVPTGQLLPSRLLQIMTDANKKPGVVRAYTDKELGRMSPRLQTIATTKANFYRALAANARTIFETQMPDVHEMNQNLSRNFNLQEGIQRSETRNPVGQILMRHTGAIAGAVAGGALVGDEGEGMKGRAKHALGWAALTELMSGPRGINFLTEVARQSPRVINTMASWATPDATK